MKRKKYRIWLLLLPVLFLVSCGNDKAGEVVTGHYYNPKSEVEEATETIDTKAKDAEESKTIPEIGTELFLITNNDMQSECLILEQLASGKQYMYYYSMATRFLDKYGNRASVSYFEPGRIILVGEKDEEGRLLQAQISDQVWEYPDVSKYSIDTQRGVFDIAGTKYSFDEDIYVNSDGNPQKLEELTDLDVLRVIGLDKKILSVSVTTGHGELQLTNTRTFEGSYIQIGNKIFSEVTSNMKMEIPEGTYTVAVANNGYGGSTEIEVKRGQNVTLDLDTLKGEGPKYGKILFAIDVAGAVLQIDGRVVDYSEPISLQYGVHSLSVEANNYDTYSKRLYVNSPEATIVVGLTGSSTSTGGTTNSETATDADAADKDTDTTTDDPGLAGSLAGSHTGSTSGTDSSASSSQSDTNLDEDALNAVVDSILNQSSSDSSSNSDYLSTLTELLSSLTGSGDD